MSARIPHLGTEQFRRDHTVSEARASVMERVAPRAGLLVTILGTGNEGFAYGVITSDPDQAIQEVPIPADTARIAITGDARGKDEAIGRLYDLTNEEEQRIAKETGQDALSQLPEFVRPITRHEKFGKID